MTMPRTTASTKGPTPPVASWSPQVNPTAELLQRPLTCGTHRMGDRCGNSLRTPLIFEAARSEFRKLEKPVNEAEFRLMQAVEAKA